MIRALVTGTLHNDPQARTSQNGKPFTTGKLKADASENGIAWVSLIGFQEQAERLATLKAGQAISISGRAKLTAWLNKQGEAQAGLDVVIDELATLRPRPKPKPEPAQAGFDDDLAI
ncbi:MAG: single-stranded DNA-binding protein [Candidatus Competibacteraceae bacterium]|nr:single-stranded DNA-binding protein [Candidatus Competibacteraceae bacterium]MCP5127253.1 single-stranded DNA-binding protein [Gammaproteobacteria bacterium]HRX72264.1 single-stranded DNA-binding protein [Candidatus Competibacteraceae bacterium]